MYILFDIGGTKMRLAASKDLNTFSEPVIVPTPSDFDKGIRVFKEETLKLTNHEKVKALAGLQS